MWQILRYARNQKGRKIFEIFNSKGQSEFLVASRARWHERQRVLVTQEEESRRRTQELDYEGNQSWAAVYQSISRRVLSQLHNSEALEVSTKELKEQVLSPNEPSVNIERIAGQARSEKRKKLFLVDQQTRSKQDPSRQCGEMGGASENVDSSGEGMRGTQGSNWAFE